LEENMSKPAVGPDKEFFSEWHRDRFLEGCEREVLGCRRRIAELEDVGLEPGDPALDQAKLGLKNALAEVARVGGEGPKPAAKPRKKAAAKK